MVNRFTEKIALITGAGSGIGRAVAIRLADEGAKVLAVDVDPAAVKGNRRTSGRRGSIAPRRFGRPRCLRQCRWLLCRALRQAGRAREHRRHLHGGPYTGDDARGVPAGDGGKPRRLLLCPGGHTHLLESQGNIVNIASNAGIQGVPYSAAYCMSKGGVVQLTRSLAVEYPRTPLRVNAIAPAVTNTNIARSATFPADMDPALASRMAGFRGMAEPEEVATLFAFLASEEARSVTGALYTIDNGLTVS